MSAPDWTTYVIAYTRRTTYVIAYTRQCMIGISHAFYVFILWHLANFYWFLDSDSKT